MSNYVIDASDDPGPPPLDLIDSVLTGNGGQITIEPNSPPQKVLWSLKSVLQALGIGFQWATINKMTKNGMHGEHAEHHVTKMINDLCTVKVPPLPSQEEIDEIKSKLGDAEQETKDSTE